MTIKSNLTGSGVAGLTASKIVGTVTTGLTAAGSTSQANSLAIFDDVNVSSTTAANTGVRLPSTLSAGDNMIVANTGAQTLFMYPPVGGTINGGSANAKIDVATLKVAYVVCINNLDFVAVVGA